jgi:hypothetical protein
MSALISDSRHTVTRGESLIDWGYRPHLTPCHHALLDTGIRSKTCGNRKNLSFILVLHLDLFAKKTDSTALPLRELSAAGLWLFLTLRSFVFFCRQAPFFMCLICIVD